MGNLKQKIDAKRDQVADAQKQYKEAKRDAKDGTTHSKMSVETWRSNWTFSLRRKFTYSLFFFRVLDKKKKAVERLKEQLMKLEVQETDKEENKTIALGTSKLNYLDPRISVAWYVAIYWRTRSLAFTLVKGPCPIKLFRQKSILGSSLVLSFCESGNSQTRIVFNVRLFFKPLWLIFFFYQLSTNR